MTATDPVRLALVGIGKIARDQHVPTIARNPAFELAATVSRSGGLKGVQNFKTIGELLEARPDISAVSLCQPPQVRYEAAAQALSAGRHVMLEKPPGASVGEVQALSALAEAKGVSLFATWHSRFAAAVEPAARWLSPREIRRVTVTWKEDVRRWHPGQAWIWEPGGLGIFDPGINALSIVTAILPVSLRLTSAVLEFPEGREAPIAATLDLVGETGFPVHAEFDWRQTGPQTWDIEVETDDGTLKLSHGGAEISINGETMLADEDREYESIYRRFSVLIACGRRDVDLAPLTLVADAFLLGRRENVAPFVD